MARKLYWANPPKTKEEAEDIVKPYPNEQL